MSRCPSRSAIKAATNVTLGWVAALATQVVVFPVMGLQVMLWQSLALTGVFTTVSFLHGMRCACSWFGALRMGRPPGRRNASAAPTPGRRLRPN